jgi:hypothetical protein
MLSTVAGMVCFNGQDQSGPYRLQQKSVGCLMVTVARCMWYVQSEDSLIQIAARFSTNWLQVWHFNPTLLHPDDSLEPQSLINIGHLYEVSCSQLLLLDCKRVLVCRWNVDAHWLISFWACLCCVTT